MKTTYEVRTHNLSMHAMLSQAHTLHTMANRNPWLRDFEHRHVSDYDDFGRSYPEAVRSVGHTAMGVSRGYLLSARQVSETDRGKQKPLEHFRTVGFARAWPDVNYDHMMGIGIWDRGIVLSYWLDKQFDDRINKDPGAQDANMALHQSVGSVLLEQAGAHVPQDLHGEDYMVACFANPESAHSPLGLMTQMDAGNYGVVHVHGADYNFRSDNAANARVYQARLPRPASV